MHTMISSEKFGAIRQSFAIGYFPLDLTKELQKLTPFSSSELVYVAEAGQEQQQSLRKNLFQYADKSTPIYPGFPMKMKNIVWTNTNSPGKVQQNFEEIKDNRSIVNYYNAEFYVSVLNQGQVTSSGVEIFDDMHLQTEISQSGDNISYQNYYS